MMKSKELIDKYQAAHSPATARKLAREQASAGGAKKGLCFVPAPREANDAETKDAEKKFCYVAGNDTEAKAGAKKLCYIP